MLIECVSPPTQTPQVETIKEKVANANNYTGFRMILISLSPSVLALFV